MIETLGAAGYYQGGPELGIELVVSGVSHRSRNRYQAFNRHKTRAFNTLVHQLERGGLMHTDHIQWFQAGDGLAPMGVKMIGVFCQFIRPMDFIDPQKYIAGFQHLPNVVPGFGSLEFNADKVSMRVPPLLGDLIQKGEKPGLDTFFPQATNQLGGFSDGCHRLAAATTVGRGNEKALIREMDIRLGQVSPI